MSDNGSILAVIEPDNRPQTTVDRAIWLAKLLGCELDLLLCDAEVGALASSFCISNESKQIAQMIRQAQEDTVNELAEPARKAGLPVTTDVLEERPVADGVLSKALNSNPRFVMKGTRYHSIAKRAIMIDTDWQLIRACPFPLWLVKPGNFQEEPVTVAAIDPMHEHDKPAALDQAIIDAARSIAGPAGGDVHLLHIYERLTDIGSAANRTFKPVKLPTDKIDERTKSKHREALDAIATRNGFDKEHTHQLPGRTHEIMPAFTRSKKADLVVMGGLARWGIKRMVIGSTAERVLDHLLCDVLIVRAD